MTLSTLLEGRESARTGRSRIVCRGGYACDLCGGPDLVEAYSGIRLVDDSWTGDDIFMPWGLNGMTVVTDRVVALASARRLANVTTTPLEEYSWDPRAPRPMALRGRQ